jgi:glutamate---cysteine ligase / carboxylate-amine ligase
MLTVGVEEEFHVYDPVRRCLALGGLPGLTDLQRRYPGIAGFDNEFQASMVESRTGVCDSLEMVRAELESLRDDLVGTAAASGLAVLSAGTMPTVDWRIVPVTPKPRYLAILDHYREIARRRNTCGCHVHVGVPDRELATQVLGRVWPWLPTLLALSASSPFTEYTDTGYHSARSLLWSTFPVAGMPGRFASYAEYTARVSALVEDGLIPDEGNVYWDARLGLNYATLEFRVADACSTVDEAVLQAALCRALVATGIRETMAGDPVPDVRPELYRAAVWRAARSGTEGTLLDLRTGRATPAWTAVGALLDHVADALHESGDWHEVRRLLIGTRTTGTSSQRQRATYARTGILEDVTDHLVAETTPQATLADGVRQAERSG